MPSSPEGIVHSLSFRGRLHPQPMSWRRLYDAILAGDGNAMAGDAVKAPPILDEWRALTDAERTTRFHDHLALAAQLGILDQIEGLMSAWPADAWYAPGVSPPAQSGPN